MKVQWKRRNVCLSMLVDAIQQFFKERNFSVFIKNSNIVVVTPRRLHGVTDTIHVTVNGEPNEFTVIFDAGQHSRVLRILGTATAFFGGGTLGLKGLKSTEALEKLERTFWAHITEEIRLLEGSAG